MASYILLAAQSLLAGVLGLLLGLIAAQIEKRKGRPSTWQPDTSFVEKRRLLLLTKVLVAVSGMALILAGQLTPHSLWKGWSALVAWHPLSGGDMPRALLTYLGSFALGIGLALPLHPKVLA